MTHWLKKTSTINWNRDWWLILIRVTSGRRPIFWKSAEILLWIGLWNQTATLHPRLRLSHGISLSTTCTAVLIWYHDTGWSKFEIKSTQNCFRIRGSLVEWQVMIFGWRHPNKEKFAQIKPNTGVASGSYTVLEVLTSLEHLFNYIENWIMKLSEFKIYFKRILNTELMNQSSSSDSHPMSQGSVERLNGESKTCRSRILKPKEEVPKYLTYGFR